MHDRIIAAVDLIGRSGARSLEFGYLWDDVPVDQAGWWAHATYRGRRVMVDSDLAGPAEALEALTLRILDGAECQLCHQTVSLPPHDLALGTCRWYRSGARWQPGCTPDRPTTTETTCDDD